MSIEATVLELSGNEPTAFGPAIGIAFPLDVSIADSALKGIDIHFELRYSHQLRRAIPADINIDYADDAPADAEITGSTLRKLTLKAYCAQSASVSVRQFDFDEEPARWSGAMSFLSGVKELDLDSLKSKDSSGRGDLLLLVAQVYRFAEVTNGNPTATVSEIFNVSYPTAARWVARAKKTVPDFYGEQLNKILTARGKTSDVENDLIKKGSIAKLLNQVLKESETFPPNKRFDARKSIVNSDDDNPNK